MRALPFHVIPIFLSRTLPGELGSQLRMFDVFYKYPPVVGWHVIGAEDGECSTVGFFAHEESPSSEGVVGLSVGERRSDSSIAGFTALELESIQESVVGLEVYDEEASQEGVTAFSVADQEEPSEYVAGFIVEET